ncbi:hypothetical protein C7S17_4788 [Burkholderia thailandensis]|nr:hypothetical protein [Burkholderia thailandensis]
MSKENCLAWHGMHRRAANRRNEATLPAASENENRKQEHLMKTRTLIDQANAMATPPYGNDVSN